MAYFNLHMYNVGNFLIGPWGRTHAAAAFCLGKWADEAYEAAGGACDSSWQLSWRQLG